MNLRAYHAYITRMARYGITEADADSLRRIEMTLHRWHEQECNGDIQRDGEDGEGKPRRYYGPNHEHSSPCPDREAGARKRLARIMEKYPTLGYYVHGDPRGCALYIWRKEDMTASRYNMGAAVCL